MGGESLHRLAELPRMIPSPDGDVDPDPFLIPRRAALTARFHEGTDGLVWVWHRRVPGGPVSLLTSDGSIAPPSSLLVPDHREPDPDWSWLELVALHDGLLGSGASDEGRSRRHSPGGVRRPSVESCLLAVWDGPFAVVVTADPVRLGQIEEEVERTVDALRFAQQRKETNPDRAVEADRLRGWHRELRASESTGLWRLHVRVGVPDPAIAREVAGLVIASYDLTDLGYTLRMLDPAETPEEEFLGGTDLLAALTRPPSTEVPGIRLVLPSEFDVNVETAVDVRDALGLGAVLDRQRRPAGPFRVGLGSLNRHTFICGATGAGKSQTTRHLLTEAVRAGVPFLVVEPAKSEYAAMAARLPGLEVVRVRPGDPEGIAGGIDPLRPAVGFPLQTHIDLVKALFLAAFDADEPFPQVLAAALSMAYERQGWDLALSEPAHAGVAPRYPTLADVQACAMRVVAQAGYGREVEDNIRGFMRVRLGSLRLGTTGRFLEGGHPIDIGRLLASNVVLEIEDVGDDYAKAFLMGAVLVALVEHYRVAERRGRLPESRLRHVTVFEEAHRLLRNTEGRGAARQAVEMFASLLAEVRAYGEGIVVAEQIPSKLIPDVIKNTAVKIVHRLPAQDDRDTVGATMNLSEAQSKYLVTVPPGVAGCFADGMDQPVLVQMPDGTALEHDSAAIAVGAEALARHEFGRCHADHGPILHRLTVATVARARRRVETDPMLRWWLELTVIAHLVGYRAPVPNIEIHRGYDRTIAKTAILYGVDEAVASRSALLADKVSPAGLAAHVTGTLLEILEGGPGCRYVEHQWLAGPYRWELIYHQLLEHCKADGSQPCGRRHPDTNAWKARYGVRIPGRTCADQEQTVQEWRRSAQPAVAEDIGFGLDHPSALERATGLTRLDPAWPEKVTTYLDALNARWADRLLIAGLAG